MSPTRKTRSALLRAHLVREFGGRNVAEGGVQRAPSDALGRARVLVLCLLAAGLLFAGSGRTPEADGAAQSGGAAQADGVARSEETGTAAGPELDAVGVAAVLESVNPTLAPREIDRVAAAVVRYSAAYGLDPELVTAVLLVESSARPWVRSPKGAIGLMQVMPHMMEPLGLAGNVATIESNIEAGCFILANNIRRLGEDRGILSYFWGSRIRGDAYLGRVREARAAVRELRAS